MAKKFTLFNPNSPEVQKAASVAKFQALSMPGSDAYKQMSERQIAEAQLAQTKNAASRNFGANVGAAAPFFQVFKPLIFGAVILLLIAGPGIMGISNIAFNTPIWAWIGGLFIIILLFKLGVFGKR